MAKTKKKTLKAKAPAKAVSKKPATLSKKAKASAPAKASSKVKTPAKKVIKSKSPPLIEPVKVPKKVVAEIVEDDEDLRPTDEASDEEAYQENDDIVIDSETEIDSDLDVDKVSPRLPAIAGSKAVSTADPVAAYLAEIRKYPLLSKEQELALAKKYYDTKDPAAAQALVTANLRFVVKVAAEYSRFGARMIDLIQEGNMGLMHGVREFNPYKGVKLITYAVWWIRGYIQEYLMKQYSLVKIGTTQNQKKLFYQLQRQRAELDAMGKSPDIKTISERLGIPEDEVQMMAQRMSGRDVSLDKPLGDDSSSSMLDMQSEDGATPDEELSRAEELSYLNEAIEELKPSLSDREKIILEERILNDEPLTLQEIGEKYGITREAVRQMEARLMKKIKEQFAKTESVD